MNQFCENCGQLLQRVIDLKARAEKAEARIAELEAGRQSMRGQVVRSAIEAADSVAQVRIEAYEDAIRVLQTDSRLWDGQVEDIIAILRQRMAEVCGTPNP